MTPERCPTAAWDMQEFWYSVTKEGEIMDLVYSLPIDMKLELVDRLLESITPSRKEIDEAWSDEVERRIDEVESGKFKLITFEEVRERFRKRYSR